MINRLKTIANNTAVDTTV
jgi:hypothetical protein